jgi:hypothetical protein
MGECFLLSLLIAALQKYLQGPAMPSGRSTQPQISGHTYRSNRLARDGSLIDAMSL